MKFLTLPLLLFLIIACDAISDKESKVLVFSKTATFRHKSISSGIQLFEKLAKENQFQMVRSEQATDFNDNYLKTFKAIVFLNTTGDVLNEAQQKAMKKYINSGGGFLGIHSAADTEHDWPWYGQLVGAYFKDHPNDPNVRTAAIDCLNSNHQCCRHLPKRWQRTDEWYNYHSINPNVNVVLNLDESSYEGGTNGSEHPIAWYHAFDGGRAFYTGGGLSLIHI